MIKQKIISAWSSRFNKPIRLLLGNILLHIGNKNVVASAKNKMLVEGDSFTEALLIETLKNNAQRKLKRDKGKAIARIWEGEQGYVWHKMLSKKLKTSPEFEMIYAQWRALQTNQINIIISQQSEIEYMVEVGTGNGYYLNQCSQQFSRNIKHFVGFDLNKKIIQENRKLYSQANLTFQDTDFIDWINHLKLPTCIIIIFCGTLEYFELEDVQHLFAYIKKSQHKFYISLNEPVNIDLETNFESERRLDLMYSHNYPYLMDKAGLKILTKEVIAVPMSELHTNQVILSATNVK